MDGVGQARVGEGHAVGGEVEAGEGERAEEPVHPAPAEGVVDVPEELGGGVALEGPGPHVAGGEGAVQRSRYALARHVADRQAKHAVAEVVEVVEVTAQHLGGYEVGGSLPAGPRGAARAVMHSRS